MKIQMTEIEKIEIPEEPKQEVNIQKDAKSMADLMKLSITEEKKFVPLDKFKWMCDLETNSVIHIIRKIQDFTEIVQNDWHFIPFDIPAELQKEHNRKNGAIQFFCIDDQKTLKKFTKTIRKYFPLGKVNWETFNANEYKQQLQKEDK